MTITITIDSLISTELLGRKIERLPRSSSCECLINMPLNTFLLVQAPHQVYVEKCTNQHRIDGNVRDESVVDSWSTLVTLQRS